MPQKLLISYNSQLDRHLSKVIDSHLISSNSIMWKNDGVEISYLYTKCQAYEKKFDWESPINASLILLAHSIHKNHVTFCE